jgi:site-specific recombinase XerD
LSAVLEELPLRELFISLLGDDWRKRLNNRHKTNAQLFAEYFDLIASSKSAKWNYETRRLLNQFWEFIGEYPPTIELFTQFFQRFSKLALSTRARYYYVFSAFFDWYSGQKLPFKIKAPKKLPQHVPDEDIEKLVAAMRSKKSHKGTIYRDIMLVETFCHTGLRRAELSNLKINDLQLSGEVPQLLVRQGKGGKDRVVYLDDYIRDQLASFVKGKHSDESVFGLAPKTVSLKIGYWARKAGVPIHTHSLRHKFATDILDRGGNVRAVQQLLGHESLGTTEAYLAITNNTLRDAVNLLDTSRKNKSQSGKSISDPGIPDLQVMLDPANLEQPLHRNTVEEVHLAQLPKIDRKAGDYLKELVRNHAQRYERQ